jgi:hypothetical protein
MLMTGAGSEAAEKTPARYRKRRVDSRAAWSEASAVRAGARRRRLLEGSDLRQRGAGGVSGLAARRGGDRGGRRSV